MITDVPTMDDRSGAALGRDEHPRRTLGRRRALPNGRAVVGGLLVAVAATGAIALSTSQSGPAPVSVVVAAVPLEPGDPLGPDVLRSERLALPDSLVDATYEDAVDLEGTVVRSTLEPGEILQSGDVIESSSAQRAAAPAREISFRLDAERVGGGRLEGGDTVDVVATYGTGVDSYTTLVLADARVLSARVDDDALTPSGQITLTLALDTRDEALALAHAIDIASVRVVRTTTARADDPGAEDATTFTPAPSPIGDDQ